MQGEVAKIIERTNLMRQPFYDDLHCKKRLAAFPSPSGMSLATLSLAGNN
jgi:hypothetical protein